MIEPPVILLGLGFTAARLAVRLRRAGRLVYGASRRPERFGELLKSGVLVGDIRAKDFPAGAVLAHTIPPVEEPDRSSLREFLLGVNPARIVYVSATSVYGELAEVDSSSSAVPSNLAGLRRMADEEWLASGPWSCLILRAAAIYGPGRGAHRRLLEPGTIHSEQRRGPSGLVSRIHVDDLARLVAAGLDSALTGAFPVGDKRPCSTAEILMWCAEYLGREAGSVNLGGLVSTGRRVDGGAVLNALRVELDFPDYREGIAACLREEGVI